MTVDAVNSNSKQILSFTLPELDPVVTATIDEMTKKITATVPYGTDVKTLKAAVIVSDGATVTPKSETVKDFTNPVIYIVTAENNTMESYDVTVTVAHFAASTTSVDKTSVAPAPTLVSFDKTEYMANADRMVITGQNLYPDANATIYFIPASDGGDIGRPIEISQDGTEAILSKVPNFKPGDYDVSISFDNGKKTRELRVKITANTLPVPTITKVSSTDICQGETFTITGTNLDNPVVIMEGFWAYTATVVSSTKTEIVVSATGMPTGEYTLKVESNGQSATYGTSLKLTRCPAEVTGISSASGKRGSTVTITGKRFDSYDGYSFTIGDAYAGFGKFISETEYQVTVPQGAASGSGKLEVSLRGETIFSAAFTVLDN